MARVPCWWSLLSWNQFVHRPPAEELIGGRNVDVVDPPFETRLESHLQLIHAHFVGLFTNTSVRVRLLEVKRDAKDVVDEFDSNSDRLRPSRPAMITALRSSEAVASSPAIV
ncbi:hypothetical protein HAPAU_32220 [Halalkalicoccus paucihalophilus]|uniref:Uncharacterized protein n=1 Tax=Halalkalicoccus paucihalophilus TaxID=1008153 RepID=A0A151AB40_9EURY|nr:hypothetical protein HAPAU_32220 [Halalkalicoccus paucihalophilus]